MRICFLAALLLIVSPLQAQRVEMSKSLEKISSSVMDKVELDLDASMIAFASKLLSDDIPEELAAKKIVAGLKGIYVRKFNFPGSGPFGPADLQAIREQLKSPLWTRFVVTMTEANKKKDPKPKRRNDAVNAAAAEQIEVWVCREAQNVIGMVVVSWAPSEITIVNIVGSISPEDFAALGGRFGIPRLNFQAKEENQR